MGLSPIIVDKIFEVVKQVYDQASPGSCSNRTPAALSNSPIAVRHGFSLITMTATPM